MAPRRGRFRLPRRERARRRVAHTFQLLVTNYSYEPIRGEDNQSPVPPKRVSTFPRATRPRSALPPAHGPPRARSVLAPTVGSRSTTDAHGSGEPGKAGRWRLSRPRSPATRVVAVRSTSSRRAPSRLLGRRAVRPRVLSPRHQRSSGFFDWRRVEAGSDFRGASALGAASRILFNYL